MSEQASARRRASIPTYPDLDGKIAVVTGGSGEIGAATSRLLATNGARVGVNGRDEVAIDAVVAGIQEQGGQAFGAAADVTDSSAVENMRERVEGELGPADLLVAFAGGGIARPGPTAGISEADWRSTVDGNLTATFLTIRSFLPGMIERGRGSIITMASSAARFPTAAPAPYAAAKAGVIMLTKHLANEVGEHGVRVNCLAPHTILTGRIRRVMPEDRRSQLEAEIPLARLGTSEDVGLATLFLASDASAWITGVTLDVAGGGIMT